MSFTVTVVILPVLKMGDLVKFLMVKDSNFMFGQLTGTSLNAIMMNWSTSSPHNI